MAMNRAFLRKVCFIMVAVMTVTVLSFPILVHAEGDVSFGDIIGTDKLDEYAENSDFDSDVLSEEDFPDQNDVCDTETEIESSVDEIPVSLDGASSASSDSNIVMCGDIKCQYNPDKATLELSGNGRLDGKISEVCEDFYKNNKKIQKIIFNNCSIRGNGKQLLYKIENVESIDCKGLSISQWEKDSSETAIAEEMFYGCSDLKEVSLDGLDMSEVTEMTRMFAECSSLEKIELKGLKLPKLSKLNEMFSKCVALKTVTISDMQLPKLNDVSKMFIGCGALENVTMTGLDMPSVTNMSYMFQDCGSLVDVDFSSSKLSYEVENNYYHDSYGVFSGCVKLIIINNFEKIGSGANIDLPEEFTVEGEGNYRTLLSGENGNAGKKLINSRIAKSYYVIFDLNGGEGPVLDCYISTVPAGALPDCADIHKEGYVFDAWTITYGGKEYQFKNNQFMTNVPFRRGETLTFCAKWKPVTYSIKFTSKEPYTGKTPSMAKLSYGKSYELKPNKFKRTGYSFSGWNTKEDGRGDYYPNMASVKNLTFEKDGVVTLYAQWVKGYAITYELKGGVNNQDNPANYDENTKTIVLKEPTRAGFQFAGWFDKKKKKLVTEIPSGSSGDKTFYAKWTPNKYTIHFERQGSVSPGDVQAVTGTMSDKTKCACGSKIKLPALKFSKKGYTFVGWNTRKDGGGTVYKNGATVQNLSETDGDVVTLYAQWKLTEYKITYNLKFTPKKDLGDGNSAQNPTSYNVQSAKITLASAKRTGYIFDGWFSKANCKEKYRVTEIPAGSKGNVTLYAKWKPIKYNVMFNANASGVVGTMKDVDGCSYGKQYKLKKCPYMRFNYKFAGWSTTKNGPVEYKNGAKYKNLTSQNGITKILYAVWVPK